MPVRLSLDGSVGGFRALTLENELLRVTVVPDVGAKIHELFYKPLGRDLLYHHPRVELRAPVFGVSVDNWWTGGIDEALPTGHPCTVEGENLPFLGEAWSLPWEFEQTGDAELHLSRCGVITPFRIERRMSLDADSPVLRQRHRITNIGVDPFHFIWGIHPGVPIGPATRIQIPGTIGVIAESEPRDRLGSRGDEYSWPLPAMTDIGAEPGKTADLHYVTGLTGGWLAVRDDTWRTGFGMTFPSDVLRCVWVWLVDGGWRGLRCVAVEPWLGYPARLDEAIAMGNAHLLAPGEELSVETSIIAFVSTGPIGGFDESGSPLPETATSR